MKVDDSLLQKYARVMVHYALNDGKGINKGDTVFLVGQECTKDLFMAMAKEVYAAGGNLITNYQPNNLRDNSLARFLLQNGSDEQIAFSPHPTGRESLKPPTIYSLSFQSLIFITWKISQPRRSA
jgi:aminopeptidase